MRRTFTLTAAFLMLAAAPLAAYYKPWYLLVNFNFGAKALAMGNAFTAVADDASASFWNPAGLSELGDPEFHLSYRACRQSHVYDTLTIANQELPGEKITFDSAFRSRVNGIDFFAVSLPARFWGLDWGFAVSYFRYFPSGFTGEMIDTTTYRGETETVRTVRDDFYGSEGQDMLAASASCRTGSWLSLGLTVQQFFNSGSLHYHTVRNNYEYSQDFTEKLKGRSFIAGILLSPLKRVRLGFAYHSAADVRMPSSEAYQKKSLEGVEKTSATYSCQALVHLPSMFSLGVRLDPLRRLVLSLDYSEIRWASSTMRDYYGQTKTLPFPVRNDRPSGLVDNDPFIPSNSVNLRLGMEWNIPLGGRILHLRSGWFIDRELVRDELDQTVKTKGYSLGAGVELSAGLRAEFTIFVKRAVWMENSYLSATETIHTRYHNDVFNLALVYQFGNLFRHAD